MPVSILYQYSYYYNTFIISLLKAFIPPLIYLKIINQIDKPPKDGEIEGPRELREWSCAEKT